MIRGEISKKEMWSFKDSQEFMSILLRYLGREHLLPFCTQVLEVFYEVREDKDMSAKRFPSRYAKALVILSVCLVSADFRPIRPKELRTVSSRFMTKYFSKSLKISPDKENLSTESLGTFFNALRRRNPLQCLEIIIKRLADKGIDYAYLKEVQIRASRILLELFEVMVRKSFNHEELGRFYYIVPNIYCGKAREYIAAILDILKDNQLLTQKEFSSLKDSLYLSKTERFEQNPNYIAAVAIYLADGEMERKIPEEDLLEAALLKKSVNLEEATFNILSELMKGGESLLKYMREKGKIPSSKLMEKREDLATYFYIKSLFPRFFFKYNLRKTVDEIADELAKKRKRKSS